jgi:hypothetical protein
MSSEARGRVGGTVYNTWRGIRYAKQQTSPAQPRSIRQLQIRAWAVYLVRLWATIGDDARLLWNNYAVEHPDIDWTNRSRRLTGLNWFVRVNTRLLDIPKPIITSPPTAAAPNPLELFAAADGSGSSVLTWTATADWGDYVQVFVQGPHSAGAKSSIHKAKLNQYAQGPSGTATLASLPAGTYDVWARVVYQDTGLASAWVADRAVVS